MLGFLLAINGNGPRLPQVLGRHCCCRVCDRVFVMVVGSIIRSMVIIVAIRQAFLP